MLDSQTSDTQWVENVVPNATVLVPKSPSPQTKTASPKSVKTCRTSRSGSPPERRPLSPVINRLPIPKHKRRASDAVSKITSKRVRVKVEDDEDAPLGTQTSHRSLRPRSSHLALPNPSQRVRTIKRSQHSVASSSLQDHRQKQHSRHAVSPVVGEEALESQHPASQHLRLHAVTPSASDVVTEISEETLEDELRRVCSQYRQFAMQPSPPFPQFINSRKLIADQHRVLKAILLKTVQEKY
ncbi:hypothetical protein FRC02_007377 [Tulasnella sp. 418]|nr:hypothetical protein FRC02_007377 [Tulasnella sp. 418]